MIDNNNVEHLTTKTINVKAIIMGLSLIITLMSSNAYSFVFAEDWSDSEDSSSQDDQPRGSGDDCHYTHGNSGVLSPCHPTAGNPPLKVD